MANDIIPFPDIGAFPDGRSHRLARGGMDMNIKHTHPAHESSEAQEEKLQDIHRTCVTLLAAMRADSKKRSA